MAESDWTTAETFAQLAGISPQAARKALRRASVGEPWRAHLLETRVARGRGGKAGLCHQVSLRSVAAALGLPSPTPASSTLVDPNCSHRTAYRKQALIRKGGEVAAMRKRPSNAGKPRVAISRAFTRLAASAGWTEAQAWAAHQAAKTHARSLWTTRAADMGARRIAGMVRDHLKRVLAAELLEHTTPAEAREAFNIPRRFVEDERVYALVNRKRTDAKAHYDARPGVLLDLNLCRPMEAVYGDVHHLDVKMRREDGEEAFCVKMVAWMDAGSRRVFARFFNVEKGKMIRQDHVAESFALMACHRDYGMPQTIYIDNGSEYKMLDHMKAAFCLMGEQGYSGSLVHSTAYNPRGKAALESFFKHFERYYLSAMPGYAGGDRQKQKTANQGKAIAAAPWAWEDAQRILYALLDRYNEEDPRETINGLTPNEKFRKDAADWSPVTVSMEALAFGHARRVERSPRQGLIRHENRLYRLTGPAALADKVTALVSPWMQDGLVVQHGGELIFAPEAQRYHPLDREGAKASAALASDFNRQIEALAAELPSTNPLAQLLHGQPAMLDLLEGPKAAVTKAISTKARRTEEARQDAEQRAQNAQVQALLSQGIQRRRSNARVA